MADYLLDYLSHLFGGGRMPYGNYCAYHQKNDGRKERLLRDIEHTNEKMAEIDARFPLYLVGLRRLKKGTPKPEDMMVNLPSYNR